MSINNLLIAYNGGEASDSALHLAVMMANKYDAHLTGIVAHGTSNVARNVPKWLFSSMHDTIADMTAQRTQELETKFREKTKSLLPADHLHWIDVNFDPDRVVTDYSRVFDITVLGQYENLVAADELILHPDRIAYDSGRPIIVAPKKFQPEFITKKAVVAWDGRRSSSRAFFDAMQILQTKDTIEFITIGEARKIHQPTSIDLSTMLARHGFNATHKFLPHTGSIGDAILEYCEQVDAGLLVMGAYQHSKLSEDLFGGVTASILKKIDIPLFLSH